MEITTVVLAGGQNKRMQGFPKWDLEFGQGNLLDRAIKRLSSISNQILVVTAANNRLNNQNAAKIVYDKTPHLGPLNGINTAIEYVENDFFFVIGVDMPYFSPKLAQYMANLALTENLDIVLPKWEGRAQPLHAIYSTNIRASLAENLANERYSLNKWINEQKKIYILAEAEIEKYNINGKIFFNMNTPEDYQQGLSWIAREDNY